MSPVRWLKSVIRISVQRIPVCAVEGTAEVHASTNREAAAPGVRRSVGNAMCRPNGERGLERVIIRPVGVIAVVESGKLRVGHDEILRKQSARTKRAAVNDLTPWLDSTDICCVQGTSDTCEVSVRDEVSEGRVKTKRLRPGHVRTDNTAAEIQTFEHLIEHRGIPAGTRGCQSLE